MAKPVSLAALVRARKYRARMEQQGLDAVADAALRGSRWINCKPLRVDLVGPARVITWEDLQGLAGDLPVSGAAVLTGFVTLVEVSGRSCPSNRHAYAWKPVFPSLLAGDSLRLSCMKPTRALVWPLTPTDTEEKESTP